MHTLTVMHHEHHCTFALEGPKVDALAQDMGDTKQVLQDN